MPEPVRITDVSPRDGLQNEPGHVPAADKVRLVALLARSGVDEIEVSSFVSPKWVPQLGDAAEVFRGVAGLAGRGSAPGAAPMYSALVPNEQGLDAALAVNAEAGARVIGKVSVFTAASETFSMRNTNASIAGTLERFAPVIRRARAAGLETRGYVSCAIACPFEGPIAPARVAEVARRLLDLGVQEIALGDTIGAGDARTVAELLDAVMPGLLSAGPGGGTPGLTLHLHDTFGRAAECVRAALRAGVRSFDGAVGGLGGCPYASTPGRRAPGNIDTRLLVRTIHDGGFSTGVDLGALDEAAAFAREIVDRARAEAAS